MKWRGEKKKHCSLCCWELLNIDIIHHPPSSVFLSCSFSPVHPSYIPLFCFETPKSDPAAPQKSSTPAWCISLDIESWANPCSCCECVVEESNRRLATADFMSRWSDDSKNLSALNSDSLQKGFFTVHAGIQDQHTHINPTFTWWTGIKACWNGKHSHLFDR